MTAQLIPRWTLAPVAGFATREDKIAAALEAVLRRRAQEWDVPVPTLVLTAHAKVLAALSGERDVTSGYGVHGAPSRCRLVIDAGSWRDLVRATRRAETTLAQTTESFEVG